MATTDSHADKPAFAKEKTFSSFNKHQGANYAANRFNYHPSVYQTILDHHQATAGRLGTILDVGCGPGTAARSLAPHFDYAVGIDPSEGMIATAQKLGGVSRDSKPIRFAVSTAEELGATLDPPIANGSVDLITASAAAHWFDMSLFWPRAHEVLRPGGTIALWTAAARRVIEDEVPNFAQVQAAFDRFEAALAEYMTEGNQLTKSLYIDLPLPWTVEPPVAGFERATFLRKEWGTDDPGASSDDFHAGMGPVNPEIMEKVLGTMSPVVRWREANPDKVGTEQDVVRVMRREVEAALHEAGVEKGKELLQAKITGVVLMVKKTM